MSKVRLKPFKVNEKMLQKKLAYKNSTPIEWHALIALGRKNETHLLFKIGFFLPVFKFCQQNSLSNLSRSSPLVYPRLTISCIRSIWSSSFPMQAIIRIKICHSNHYLLYKKRPSPLLKKELCPPPWSYVIFANLLPEGCSDIVGKKNGM